MVVVLSFSHSTPSSASSNVEGGKWEKPISLFTQITSSNYNNVVRVMNDAAIYYYGTESSIILAQKHTRFKD